jgi:energy-coupling factor transporter ATP-binding protein EcfA2
MAYALENSILSGRCVTVYGPSGAGKSSLVQAAVLPKLIDAHQVRVARVDGWPVGEDPARWLSSAMHGDLDLGDPPADASPDEAISRAAKRAARRATRLMLVYVDQLEQLLYPGRSTDEGDALFDCLQHLVELPLSNVRVVLSLREDYLGRFRDRLRHRGRLLDRGFRVGPLTVTELTEAVCRAAAAGEPSQTWSREELLPLMLQVRVPGQALSEEAEAQTAYGQIVCRGRAPGPPRSHVCGFFGGVEPRRRAHRHRVGGQDGARVERPWDGRAPRPSRSRIRGLYGGVEP